MTTSDTPAVRLIPGGKWHAVKPEPDIRGNELTHCGQYAKFARDRWVWKETTVRCKACDKAHE